MTDTVLINRSKLQAVLKDLEQMTTPGQFGREYIFSHSVTTLRAALAAPADVGVPLPEPTVWLWGKWGDDEKGDRIVKIIGLCSAEQKREYDRAVIAQGTKP